VEEYGKTELEEYEKMKLEVELMWKKGGEGE